MSTILVVEDEESIAHGLQSDLEIEGYNVHLAQTALEAITAIQNEQIDLVLLDLMLPDRDGLEVCRELRRDGFAAPIIILSARDQDTDKVVGMELGADDYVTKPFSPLVLRARIKAALRRHNVNYMQNFSFGDFKLDFAKYQLRKLGNLISLTPIEFKLLSTFVQHQGQVLDRDKLLSLVWGEDIFLSDRVVDTHIFNLRKKIEADHSNPKYIISVRSVGYRFEA